VTDDQYVESIVAKYAVENQPGSDAEREACALGRLISDWAGKDLVGFQLSGSYEKGTAISLGTDVDILVSIEKPNDAQEVYLSLYRHCAERNFPPEAHGVSIRILSNGVKVHMIPWNLDHSRAQEPDAHPVAGGGKHQHTLYHQRRGVTVETNINKHTQMVRGSGRADEIRALKIWRERHHLEWPSFYLELTVMDALSDAEAPKSGSLAKNVSTVLHYLAHDFPRAVTMDPANTENVISDDLNAKEKSVISREARKSLVMGAWEKIIW